MKAKVYRFASLLFVTIGIILFCVMYVKNVDGRLVEALRNPLTIFIFLIPFVPAAVLSFLADRAEKKYSDAMSSTKQAQKK
jgi:cytochrome bd-type quinol oxidase subunit 2